MMESVTISSLGKPEGKGVNDALQWVCRSLGLFTQRDRENSCFRIFIELLKETRKGKCISSNGLAARLGIVRGAVVHHLKRLSDAGMVVRSKDGYALKSKSLKELVSGIREDVCGSLEQVEKVAAKIDGSI